MAIMNSAKPSSLVLMEPSSSLEAAIIDYKSALEALLAHFKRIEEWKLIGLSQVEDYTPFFEKRPSKLVSSTIERAALENAQTTLAVFTRLHSEAGVLAGDIETKRQILLAFPAFSRFYQWVPYPCDLLLTQLDGSPYQLWAVELRRK